MNMPPYPPPSPQPPRKEFNFLDGPYLILTAVMFFGIAIVFTSTSPLRGYGIGLAIYAAVIFLLCLAGAMMSVLKWLHYVAAALLAGFSLFNYLNKAAPPAIYIFAFMAAVVAITIAVLIESITPQITLPPTPPPSRPAPPGAPS